MTIHVLHEVLIGVSSLNLLSSKMRELLDYFADHLKSLFCGKNIQIQQSYKNFNAMVFNSIFIH